VLIKGQRSGHLYTTRHRNQNSSGSQSEETYWSALAVGSVAQLAAAHCLNEQTLDPAVCSYNRPTYAPASRTMVFTPQRSPATTRYFYCQTVLSLTYGQTLTGSTVKWERVPDSRGANTEGFGRQS